jgi:hypothetical protein
LQKQAKWCKCSNIHIYLKLLSFQSNLCTYDKIQTSYISTLCICFGLCWHRSPKSGRLKGKWPQPFPIIDFYVWRPSQTYGLTSRLSVRCDGLQQYPHKLSTKKIQDFFIDCLRSSYNIFFIWLTNVIVYSMQYVLVQHDQWSEWLEKSSQRLAERT